MPLPPPQFMHKDYCMSRDVAADYASHFGSPGDTAAGDAAAGDAAAGDAARVGIMFGRESSGLTNEEVTMAGEAMGCSWAAKLLQAAQLTSFKSTVCSAPKVRRAPLHTLLPCRKRCTHPLQARSWWWTPLQTSQC